MNGALTRKTTLDEYAGMLGIQQWDARAQSKWFAFRSEVESELQPGDEIWEWESGAFRELAGVCGLAIVRKGVVARDWQLGRS